MDPNNLVTEANELNNTGSIPLTVVLPDLTVADPSSSASLTNGCSGGRGGMNCPKYNVDLQAAIANIGGAAASNVRVRFELSAGGGATFSTISGPASAGTIIDGGSTVAVKNWDNVLPGNYLIRVTADPNDLINESDEGNNVSDFPVTVP